MKKITVSSLDDVEEISYSKLKEGFTPGVSIKELFRAKNFMVHWNKITPPQIERWHTHEQEMFGYVLKGKAILNWKENGETKTATAKQNSFVYVPPGVEHKMDHEGETIVLDVFAPPADWGFVKWKK